MSLVHSGPLSSYSALSLLFADSASIRGQRTLRIKPGFLGKWFLLIARTLALGLATCPVHAQFPIPGIPGVGRPTPQRAPVQRTQGRPDIEAVCPGMVQWVRQLQTHYPNSNLMHVSADQVERMAVPIFADASFIPYFGKAYTAMSTEELDQTLRGRILPCATSQYRSQLQLLGSVLNWAFVTRVTSHTLSPPRLVPALQKLTEARSRLAQQEQTLASLPAAAASFDEAASMVASDALALPLLWPEERAVFEEDVRNAQVRSAGPAMDAKLRPLLEAPPSRETIAALRSAPLTYAALWKLVPAPNQQEILQRIDTASKSNRAQLLAEERKQALSFAGDLAGLDAGASWYRDFEARWLGEESTPEAQKVADAFVQRREAQLAALEPELRRKINAARDGDGLTKAMAVFSLKADLASPAYASLQKVVLVRQAALTRSAPSAPAQPTHVAASPTGGTTGHGRPQAGGQSGGTLTAVSFSVAGVKSPDTYTRLYVGDFANMSLERDDVHFSLLIDKYVRTYGQACAKELPENKVEVMDQVCVRPTQLVNGYGTPVGPPGCAEYEPRHTGVFADPVLYAADLKTIPSLANTLRQGISVVEAGNGNPFAGLGGYAEQLQGIVDDVSTVVKNNACGSPAVLRFQRNLGLYAVGRQPIRLDGPGGNLPATVEPQASGNIFRDSNFSKLINDLIADNARDWLMNRYTQGSVSRIEVSLRDTLGRPAKITAHYAFTSGGPKTYDGSVVVDFADGLPQCLFFFDLPTNCKTANRKIVASYQAGSYQ